MVAHTAPAPAGPTLESVRDELRKRQQVFQQKIDDARSSQKDIEAQQKQVQADLAVIDRIVTAQAADTTTDAAVAAADQVLGNLEPKLEATLDDALEKRISQDHAKLIDEEKGLQQKINTERQSLASRQEEQTAAQQAAEAQEAVVKQRLEALNALPARVADLAKLLKQRQTELEAAAKAGDVRKGYVLYLELRVTRVRIEELRQASYKQGLVQGFVDGTKELATKREDLTKKRAAAAAQQGALDEAIADLKTLQDERPKRLQAIWSYQA